MNVVCQKCNRPWPIGSEQALAVLEKKLCIGCQAAADKTRPPVEPVKKCQVIYTAPWGDQFVATVVSHEKNGCGRDLVTLLVPEVQDDFFTVSVESVKALPKPIRPGDVLEIPEDRRRDVPLGLACYWFVFLAFIGFLLGFGSAVSYVLIMERGTL